MKKNNYKNSIYITWPSINIFDAFLIISLMSVFLLVSFVYAEEDIVPPVVPSASTENPESASVPVSVSEPESVIVAPIPEILPSVVTESETDPDPDPVLEPSVDVESQTESVSEPEPVPEVSPKEEAVDVISSDGIQGSSGGSVQNTVASSDVESSVNPSDIHIDDNDVSVEVIDQDTSNTSSAPDTNASSVIENASSSANDTGDVASDEQIDVSEESIEPLPEQDNTPKTVYPKGKIKMINKIKRLSRNSLNPESAYKISISSKKIATKREHKNKKNNNKNDKNNTELTVSLEHIDNATKKSYIKANGQCSAKYYVVLVYKHADDYEKNPSSYVVNKAYECIGGTYSYTLNDLPKNLTPGNYYIMVADQEDSGQWTPITSLIEIKLN